MRALLVLALAVALLFAACGGDNDEPSTGPPPQPPFTATLEPASAQAICGATHRVAGTVQSPELIEISGIESSPRNAEYLFWAHNDSGDTARFFAITAGGESVATFTLAGAEAVDWEDMAGGPGPDDGVPYLYFGDIGDNDSKRSNIIVYRVREPETPLPGTPASPDITDYDTLTLRYPDGAHDAETLLVDQRSSDMLIVTKNIATGVSQIFRGNGSTTAGEHTLELVGEIDFAALRDQIVVPQGAPPIVKGLPHIPTGGDVSLDGSLVVIRTYGAVFVWERPEGAPLDAAFESEPCQAPSVVEQQGEAIAFNASGTGYITISEGAYPPINEYVVE